MAKASEDPSPVGFGCVDGNGVSACAALSLPYSILHLCQGGHSQALAFSQALAIPQPQSGRLGLIKGLLSATGPLTLGNQFPAVSPGSVGSQFAGDSRGLFSWLLQEGRHRRQQSGGETAALANIFLVEAMKNGLGAACFTKNGAETIFFQRLACATMAILVLPADL